MPITFVTDAGDVLMCDFTTGFQPPEMVKVRKVVVLSARSRVTIPNTYLVVPLRKAAPAPPEGCHHEFRPRSYHFLDDVESVWAKADMLTCVGKHRLDRVKVNGRYSRVCIRKDDLMAIRRAVLNALGMRNRSEVNENKAVNVNETLASFSPRG
jgi:uncharacterized protein YifN (PemK superfamily)